MNGFDFSPLFRNAIGFDRVSQLIDSALTGSEQSQGYPPYNIEKTGEDAYRLTMAVAGFGPEDISITQHENALIMTGRPRQAEGERNFLYRGIAGRAFERRFQLADFIKVGGAELANGLLHVDLVREVPEAMKPRQIKVASARPQTIEAQQAA
ncbi:MAG: Hsp20 family protein [Alphaproteobacteria bacterium]|nr:Hsp20 family protein [Alphaproteobacteria bacterium]